MPNKMLSIRSKPLAYLEAKKNMSGYVSDLIEADMARDEVEVARRVAEIKAELAVLEPDLPDHIATERARARVEEGDRAKADAWLAEQYHYYKLRMDRPDGRAEAWLEATGECREAKALGLRQGDVIAEIQRRYQRGEPDTYADTEECRGREEAQEREARMHARRRAVPSKAGAFGPANRPMVPATPPVRRGGGVRVCR